VSFGFDDEVVVNRKGRYGGFGLEVVVNRKGRKGKSRKGAKWWLTARDAKVSHAKGAMETLKG
jgi:hypothetical protein